MCKTTVYIHPQKRGNDFSAGQQLLCTAVVANAKHRQQTCREMMNHSDGSSGISHGTVLHGRTRSCIPSLQEFPQKVSTCSRAQPLQISAQSLKTLKMLQLPLPLPLTFSDNFIREPRTEPAPSSPRPSSKAKPQKSGAQPAVPSSAGTGDGPGWLGGL